MTNRLTHRDHLAIEQMLLGRRVVEAYVGSKRFYDGPVGDPGKYWPSDADGFLKLDNGVMVYVLANEGCGGCSSGWYDLKHLATVDNVITNVRIEETDTNICQDYDAESAYTYRINVYAGNEAINILEVDGDDGNGYYGTGYELVIEFPDE